MYYDQLSIICLSKVVSWSVTNYLLVKSRIMISYQLSACQKSYHDQLPIICLSKVVSWSITNYLLVKSRIMISYQLSACQKTWQLFTGRIVFTNLYIYHLGTLNVYYPVLFFFFTYIQIYLFAYHFEKETKCGNKWKLF